MLFSKPTVELPKITAPTAAEICAQSKPSPEGKALLKPDMTPPQYQQALEKNKLPVDSVHFLAHGLPQKDGICWACRSSRLVMLKLSPPELDALKLAEGWLKGPSVGIGGSLTAALGKVDFRGPGSWCAQAALWAGMPMPAVPGVPAVALVALAVAGAILLAAGLRVGAPMSAIPQPRLQLPMLPIPPEMLLQMQPPQIALAALPALVQPPLMSMLLPFIELGKGIALGTVTCV